MKLCGKCVSKGIAIGPVFLLTHSFSEPEHILLAENECSAALQSYEAAVKQVESELAALCIHTDSVAEKNGKIFTAQKDILLDEEINEAICDCISREHKVPAWAVEQIYEQYAQLLDKSPNPLIRERAADLRDISGRLLRLLTDSQHQALSAMDQSSIIVTHELLPSDAAALDPRQVHAIVTEVGGTTSHGAIIARSYGIPAVFGVASACTLLRDGETIVVDADHGLVISEPDNFQLDRYRRLVQDHQCCKEMETHLLLQHPTTSDGISIQFYLNLSSTVSHNLNCLGSIDGVGLYRTEFLYLDRLCPPTEEEQFQVYRQVAEAFSPRPVTIRTLDIGGDKQARCLPLPQEQNPFLGNRALRFCLSHPELFSTQLRAILRASAFGSIQLMFPMAASLDDIRCAKAMTEQAKEQLRQQSVAFDPDIKQGVMIEIPGLALMADQVAAEVDFASLGTNDLTQYLLAADRGEPSVEPYYQVYHPAVFRLIRSVSQSFAKAGKPLCVCGELGGDPLGATVLIGLGLRSLSMSISSLASIKKLVCGLSSAQAAELAQKVCSCSTAEHVEKTLTLALAPLLS